MPLYVSLQASGIIMVLEQQATKPPPPGNVVQWITLLLLRNQLSQIGKHKELIMTVHWLILKQTKMFLCQSHTASLILKKRCKSFPDLMQALA